jgi:two-component system, OmpR family, alkaline phosphatase synthesis response regulator PhoP
MASILIVEDDADIVQVVKTYLEKDAFTVEVARDGLTGLDKALQHSPTLIILDWMLPGIDGITFLQRLRKTQSTPVIMLTAKTEEADRLKGLALADDYVTKPFSPRELVARVKAVLRRGETVAEVFKLGVLMIDTARRMAWRGDKVLELTTLEFDLLYFLARYPERVFTRDELLRAIWGEAFMGVDRVVDVHISNLRQKLEPHPEHPQWLLTVRGVGYKLTSCEQGNVQGSTT